MRPGVRGIVVLGVSGALSVLAMGACTVQSASTDAEEEVAETAQPAAAGRVAAKRGRTVVVASVIDGDTIALKDGRHVRLLQIDAPETGGECYSRKAGKVLRQLLPQGTKVVLEVDARLDRKDQYGRLLRYVWKRKTNVNLVLVRRGAASVWFYEGERGKYARKLLNAAERAKAREVGLWQACRGTVLDPLHAIVATSVLPVEESAPPVEQPPEVVQAEESGNCDPSYPDFCIPPPPPDLDCAQVDGSNFAVIGNDPHGFDGNDDGEGCES